MILLLLIIILITNNNNINNNNRSAHPTRRSYNPLSHPPGCEVMDLYRSHHDFKRWGGRPMAAPLGGPCAVHTPPSHVELEIHTIPPGGPPRRVLTPRYCDITYSQGVPSCYLLLLDIIIIYYSLLLLIHTSHLN